MKLYMCEVFLKLYVFSGIQRFWRWEHREAGSIERQPKHVVGSGLFLGFVDTKKNKDPQRPHYVLLFLLGSLTSPPPTPPQKSCSLPPSPSSKGCLLHLLAFAPAGHIFSVSLCSFILSSFVLEVLCGEASFSPDHIRQACCHPGHCDMWETAKKGIVLGGNSEAVREGLRSIRWVRLPGCEGHERTG